MQAEQEIENGCEDHESGQQRRHPAQPIAELCVLETNEKFGSVIVGQGWTQQAIRAFRWTEQGGMTDLGG